MKLKWIAIIVALLLPTSVMAADVLVKTGEVDGYTMAYHMEPSDGGYNLIARVERDGKPVELLKAVSKVITSDGQTLMQKMKKDGESYVSSFNIKELGQNQIMIQFKTADKKNHFIGGWYPGIEHNQ